MQNIFIIFTICNFAFNISWSQQYGITVITHGYQIPTTSAPNKNGEWMYEMAEAIIERTGNTGCICVYDKPSGVFKFNKGNNCSRGEVILIFDWASDSNNFTSGYAEAASDALFAALIRGSKNGNFNLKNIHFIGHSRGTVVNTLAVERFLILKQRYSQFNSLVSIDQVTNLDAHDWGIGNTIISDLNDAHPEINIDIPPSNIPNNGTISWKGIFSDTYWQDNMPLNGRPIQGTMNFQWNKNDQGILLKHWNIHTEGYTRTIRNNITIEGGGYNLSRIGNGYSNRPPSIYGGQIPTFSFFNKLKTVKGERIKGIMNGSFDRGSGNDIPGWEEHGGEGDAEIAGEYLSFRSNKQFRRHNYFYVPQDAQAIKFKYRNFLKCPNSTLEVTLKSGNNTKTVISKKLDIQVFDFKDTSFSLAGFNDEVVTLEFRISGSCTNLHLNIDDVEFGTLEAKSPSLFLFDLSGSMNESGSSGKPKIEEAKLAAKTTLQNISKSANQGVTQEVEIRGFSGGCVTDPTYPITNGFTTDVTTIENAINSIRYPDGGTPLAEAIEASKQKLQQHIDNTGAKQAKLIILSDGQATCTPIRPNGVFATGQATIIVPATQQTGGVGSPIKYYAVGFNIAPGSPAERDLQYLAQISGGKYLNAQNQFELTRAFQKFNRIYIPKPAPSLTNLPNTATDIFSKGLILIENETYPDALARYREFITQQPTDCNGAFNLALMCEANDLYKSAAKYYDTYLSLCPNTPDKEEVMRQIENVKKDYEIYIQYNRNVIMSDMAYLDYHFKKIQNGESVALATEFIGFIKEKWLYYKKLADILEIDTRPFKSSAQEVFRGLQDCVETIKRNPQTWDRDATPVLSRTYINMERLLQTF